VSFDSYDSGHVMQEKYKSVLFVKLGSMDLLNTTVSVISQISNYF